MKRFPLFVIALLGVQLLTAQVTLKVITVPENTPTNATLYVAGTFNGWNPSKTKMKKNKQGVYTLTIPEGKGEVSYKFTLGSWSKAEGSKNGGFLPNRTFTFTGKPQVFKLTIQSWEKHTQKKQITPISANVKVLDTAFLIPQLNRKRRIWIYLPPDYKNSTKTYPVLYMEDGQNLFDPKTSFSGSWAVGTTMDSLFAHGDYGAIVVGVDNGEYKRIDEYTPWENPKYGGGEGDLYVQFIANTLKPYIDAHYRTKPGKKYSALIGSSLGALISTYAGVKYSEEFGKVGALSPAYWIVLSELKDYILHSSANLAHTKIYFVAGSNEKVDGYKESEYVSQDIETIKKAMMTKGLKKKNILVKIDAYGEHNERYWRGEFAALYQWLFKGL